MLSWLRSFKLNEYVSSNKTNNSAIRSNVGRDGCVVFEHHFKTVVFDTPSCSASHRPVLFFSTNISFSLFRSLPSMFNSFNSGFKFRNKFL